MKKSWAILLFLVTIFGVSPKVQGQEENNVPNNSRMCYSPEIIKYNFGGNLGDMIYKLDNQWFQAFIDANPFAVEMFHVKGKSPRHPIMWWSGEFMGKHLLGGIMLYRMSGNEKLKEQIEALIQMMIAAQEEDGYWGPFPDKERLYAENWDVWGQYHLELAFLEWYELTKNKKILQVVEKNADYLCDHFLHDKPINQVTWKEANYGIMHSMGKLYRITGKKKYLDLMYQVLEGFRDDDSGDYYELGLSDRPFYTSRKPRWESLHAIQGIAELYKITGEEKYKRAYLNLQKSIRDYDIHNTGAFSTGEQAVGTPFRDEPIETCCQIAWTAMEIDANILSKDPRIADELECGLYNAIMGYTHPSCYWCTYNTPMDGVKRPAVHDIGWQSCEGGPWLSCCTANFTRGFGMLSKWALVTDKDENLYVNFYGPFQGKVKIGNNSITINQQTNYPANGHIKIDIECSSKFSNEIKLRIPFWSKKVIVSSGNKNKDATGQGYFSIKGNGDKKISVELDIDMNRDPLIGDELYSGKVSLYYGPVLLAYDQKFNDFDYNEMGSIDYSSLKLEKVAIDNSVGKTFKYKPMMLFNVRNTDGRKILLCDFASAGSYGTYYQTWLNIKNTPPANVRIRRPLNNSSSKLARFQWSGSCFKNDSTTYHLIIAKDKNFQNNIADIKGINTTNYLLKKLLDPGDYYWKVIPKNNNGSGEMVGKPARFTIEDYDPKDYTDRSIFEFRSGDSLIVGSHLDGDGKTAYGHLETVSNIHAAEDRFGTPNKSVKFVGTSKIVYSLPYFPEKYSIVCWVKPEGKNEISQIVSAWCSKLDDPSKISFNGNSFVAAIENRTKVKVLYEGVELQKWYHLAMVYDGEKICFYVNGEKIGTSGKSGINFTDAVHFSLGGSNKPDGEFFIGCIDDFAFYAKAFNQKEISEIYLKGLDLNIQ